MDKMSTSPKGIDLIKSEEGFSSFVYADSAGLPTIGYGHLISRTSLQLQLPKQETPASLKEWMERAKQAWVVPLSEDAATELLKQDLQNTERAVWSLVMVPLQQHQFDALVSFTFNVGRGNFSKSTMLQRLNRTDYDVQNEFMKWTKIHDPASGLLVESAGLKKRREREVGLWTDASGS